MKIGITVGFMNWKHEFFFGGGQGKFKVAEGSVTVLGVEITFFVKVG